MCYLCKDTVFLGVRADSGWYPCKGYAESKGNMLRALDFHSQIQKFECRTKQKQSESAFRGRAQWPGRPLKITCFWGSARIWNNGHAKVTRNQYRYAPRSETSLPNPEILVPNQDKTVGIRFPGPCPMAQETCKYTMFLGVRADSE